LARALLTSEAVTPDALAEALLLAASRGTSLARGLIAAHAIDTPSLEKFLETFLEGAPAPVLLRVVPMRDLALRLPPGLCERLQAVPVRRDPLTGTVDVAVVDARDPHAAAEVSHFLQAPVRIVRTSLASMEAALVQVHAQRAPRMRSLAPPMGAQPTREPAPAAPPLADPDIVIPLTRRNPNSVMVSLSQLQPPTWPREPEPPVVVRPSIVVQDHEPVLELKKRKAPTAPESSPALARERHPATVRGLRAPDAPPSSPLPPSSSSPTPWTAPSSPRTPEPAPTSPRTPEPAPTSPRTPEPSPAPAPVLARPQAPTLAAPVSRAAPPPPVRPAAPADIGRILTEMGAATERDRILELLVEGIRTVARQVAVLAVRREGLTGWTCSPEFADRTAFRAVKLASTRRTVLHQALDGPGPHLARIPHDEAHAPLVSAMTTPPSGDMAIVVVSAAGKHVAIVVAHELPDPRVAQLRMVELARAAGESLGRLLRDRRSSP
jgi:hypothetical protein